MYRSRYRRPISQSGYTGLNNRVSDPELGKRLETLLTNPAVQQQPKNIEFIQSLLDQFKSRNSLSHSQVQCINRLESQYTLDPEKVAAIDAWRAGFDQEKRDTVKLIARWYKQQAEKGTRPYYYHNTCEKVLNDDSYIPPEDVYRKITENKYSERYLTEYKKAPKFHPNDVVTLSASGKKAVRNIAAMIVLEATDNVNPVIGGRIYKLLPIGSDQIEELEERHLKKD